MDLSSYVEPVIEDMEKILGKPLPHGIYAGGALSALLLGRIWGCSLKVREPFEVFREVSDLIEDTSRLVTRFTSPLRRDCVPAPDLSHNGFAIVAAESSGNLIIRHVYRKEPILTGAKDEMLYLLRGLDLNVLQAGLYIGGSSSFLSATDAFFDFVASKQLRITCPVEGSAFVRLAMYQYAFRAYVDWDEEALFMAGFRQLDLPYENPFDDRLSPEEYRHFEANREKLEPCCTVKNLVDPVLPDLEVYFPLCGEICFTVHPPLDAVVAAAKTVTKRNYFLTSYTYAVCYDVLVRKSTRKSIKKRFLRAMMIRFSSEYVLRHPRCLRSDFTTCHLLELQHFNSQHPSAMQIITRLYQDFAQQLQAIRRLKTVTRRHGSETDLENAVTKITEETIIRLVEGFHLAEGPAIPPRHGSDAD